MPIRHFATALFLCAAAFAQAGSPQFANSDPNYQQLRHLAIGSEAVSVTNLVLQRDAGRLTLKSGTVCFTPAVNGRVTGAVFVGDGSFSLNPPIETERRFLNILAKDNEGLHEDFSQLALRFGDSTYDEIKQHSSGAGGSCAAGLLGELDDVFKKRFHYNISARLLEDVLSPEPGGFFAAMIKGKKYSSKELYVIDPNGVNLTAPGVRDQFAQYVDVAPEEVAFLTYDSTKDVVWSAFHFSKEYSGTKNTGAELGGGIDIEKQKLVTRIEGSGKVDGDATTTFTAQRNGTRVVAFNLFSTLRVQKVTDDAGQPLNFVQEEKNEDPGFFVILPKPLQAGERYAIHTIYSGKDAVSNSGGGTYFPIARDDWFPTNAAVSFGDYAQYDMQFSIPKGLTMVASGKLLKDGNEGNQDVSYWTSEAPQATAGFNFGKFKKKEQKLEKSDFTVQAFANTELPDSLRAVQEATDYTPGAAGEPGRQPEFALGSLSAVAMMEKPLAEANIAVRLYSDYFGPTTYTHVAMTPQATCSFGQSWPEVVYLPMCAYMDDTQRHQLVGEDLRLEFWKVVGPHEVAHQWWGHLVGFDSYRDQWMSEGFAEFSASLFVQAVYNKDPKLYLNFWKARRDLLTEKTAMGWRAIDAGPVTLGYRLANEKFGELTFRLIYPKGAYILYMLRQMMMDSRTGDRAFQEMMHDFTKTYTDRVATTEDFKAIVEKHMLPVMDIDGNHRMDWFFNEYVYGTAIPSYNLDSTFENQNGATVLKFKLTQANVTPEFKMEVPIYLELADGRVVKLGSAKMIGNKTIEQSVPLGQMKQPPKRAMVNYYYDVLATEGK